MHFLKEFFFEIYCSRIKMALNIFYFIFLWYQTRQELRLGAFTKCSNKFISVETIKKCDSRKGGKVNMHPFK